MFHTLLLTFSKYLFPLHETQIHGMLIERIFVKKVNHHIYIYLQSMEIFYPILDTRILSVLLLLRHAQGTPPDF